MRMPRDQEQINLNCRNHRRKSVSVKYISSTIRNKLEIQAARKWNGNIFIKFNIKQNNNYKDVVKYIKMFYKR